MKKYFYILSLTLALVLAACQAQNIHNESSGIKNNNKQQKEQIEPLNEVDLAVVNTVNDGTATKKEIDSKDIMDTAKKIVYGIFKVGNMSIDDTIISTNYDKNEKKFHCKR